MAEQQPLLAAVILAGRSPEKEDPLAEYSSGRSKALIPILGRPMIAYVVEALAGSRYVGRLIVVGLPSEDRPPLPIPVEHVPPCGDMLANAEAGLRSALAQTPSPDGVLVASADLPLLTPAVVDCFVEKCLETDHDLYFGIVERSVMEDRFPTSRRTYLRLEEGEFAGGDLHLVRVGVLTVDQELWQRLATARKNPIRQALMIGIWPLVKLLVRRLGLTEAERRASKALGVRGRAVVCPHAEVGMDVDKPFQLGIARAELEARSGAAASA